MANLQHERTKVAVIDEDGNLVYLTGMKTFTGFTNMTNGNTTWSLAGMELFEPGGGDVNEDGDGYIGVISGKRYTPVGKKDSFTA